jgi:hypothetical protein
VDLADASDAYLIYQTYVTMEQTQIKKKKRKKTHAALPVSVPASPWSRARGRPDAAVHPHVLVFVARADFAFPVAAGRGGAGVVCHCVLFLIDFNILSGYDSNSNSQGEGGV